jgi:ADP-heptose:LPS heptosyltransferase
LKSILCKDIARETLDLCLAGSPPKDLPRALVEDRCGDALFGILVEGLADRFEPALCDAYARLFSQAVAHASEGADAVSLVARYERVRRTRPISGKYRRIFVLSRVTLGADVAVTSVLLAAAKRRFPHAEVMFVGPRKNYELFAGDPHIHHVPVEYRRGGLRQRLSVWDQIRELVAAPDSVLIDPDSRLTQLGLLPVLQDDRAYHLFESRGYGAGTDKALPELAAAWALETFGVSGAKPYVALGELGKRGGHIAVSLGVGENPAKRLPDPFEEELLRLLAGYGAPICIDKGAGGEEAERVQQAVERSGAEATFWEGSFAGFAAMIASSKLYLGYDSAGQHVAAACGVPLISVFAGFPVPRMFDRWRPTGAHAHVIRVDQPDPVEVLTRVREALAEIRAPW